MSSEKKPPLVRRVFVIVVSLTLLGLYLVVMVAIPKQRAMRSTKSTAIIQDLREVQTTKDSHANEDKKTATNVVNGLVEESLKLKSDHSNTWNGSQLKTEPKLLMSSSKSMTIPAADILHGSIVLSIESGVIKEQTPTPLILPTPPSISPVQVTGMVFPPKLPKEVSPEINDLRLSPQTEKSPAPPK